MEGLCRVSGLHPLLPCLLLTELGGGQPGSGLTMPMPKKARVGAGILVSEIERSRNHSTTNSEDRYYFVELLLIKPADEVTQSSLKA